MRPGARATAYAHVGLRGHGSFDSTQASPFAFALFVQSTFPPRQRRTDRWIHSTNLKRVSIGIQSHPWSRARVVALLHGNSGYQCPVAASLYTHATSDKSSSVAARDLLHTSKDIRKRLHHLLESLWTSLISFILDRHAFLQAHPSS